MNEYVSDTIYDLIKADTVVLNPEAEEWVEPLHTALNNSEYKTGHAASESCNIVTRYYENEEFVRAYGLVYNGGIAIIYDKSCREYYTITLGADDGSWFPVESWTFRRKSDYIACISEALSIFNSNFRI